MTSNIKTALQLARGSLWRILVSNTTGDSKLDEQSEIRATQAHSLVDEVLTDIGDRDIPYPEDMQNDKD